MKLVRALASRRRKIRETGDLRVYFTTKARAFATNLEVWDADFTVHVSHILGIGIH